MLVSIFLPTLVAALVRSSTAISRSCAPFRNEHGKARVHSRFTVFTFACTTPTIVAFPAMAIGIIMQSVGNILLGIVNFVSNCNLRVLVPLGSAHQNQVVRVFANNRYNLVSIGLDSAPFNVGGFIVDFENNVFILTVCLRHLLEEALGFICLLVSLMRMPVDNHIDVVLDGRFDNGLQHVLLITGSTGKVAPFIIPGFIDTHGKTDNFNFHVPYHGIDCIFRIEGGSCIIGGTPIKAHAAHLHFGTILDAFAATINLALALRVLASLQLAILAHRTHASRRHSRERSRN